MCKISVIMPVYKVEKYLEKAIESILEQTFKDFELIIVDDGSPDMCGKIADQYEKKDSRVKVIHKENGGAPSARNAGIEIASGEYFFFPDSDDWIEKDYLKSLYDLAMDSKAELTISGYIMEYFEKGKSSSYVVSPNKKVFLTQKDVRHNIHQYFDNMMVAVPWNKLYKAEYITKNNLRFPNKKWDDLHFNMDVLCNINSVAISPSYGYHFFRSRAGSETTTVFDGLLYMKRREQFEHILKVFEEWGVMSDNEIMKTIYGYYAARLVQCVQEISISNSKEKRKLIKEILEDDFNYKAIKLGRINSRYIRIAILPMKLKNVSMCLIMGKTIGFVKTKMTTLFFRMKSKSINKANER